MSSKKPSIKDRALSIGAGNPVGTPPAAPAIGLSNVSVTLAKEEAWIASHPSVGMGGKPGDRAKTGPGALMQFMVKESEVHAENLRLKSELEGWEGALPIRKLDPKLVGPSEWANRQPETFTGSKFAELKAEISSAGENTQPIKVRPVPGTNPQRYEIIFGHRRHRACLDLDVPVLAMIESVDDRTLFEDMDRENRNREDPRPYEQGDMYRRALDRGLYPSLRALCDAIKVDPGNASKAVKIARLPAAVLDAFPSRLDIQYRWAQPLDEIVSNSSDIVIKRAQEIIEERMQGRVLSSAEVYSRLTTAAPAAKPKGKERTLMGKNGSARVIESNGRYQAEFPKGTLRPGQAEKLESFISSLLDE
jgi:ParB family chromosome partitioning protein